MTMHSLTTAIAEQFDRTNQAHRIALQQVRAVQGELPFQCEDGNRDEYAALNLIAGKPAFASGYSYSNAPASELACAVNRLGSIEAGQDDLRAHFERNGRDVTDEQWLDRLYPLNRAAEVDLAVAYQRVGTWVDCADLRRRTEKVTNIQALHADSAAMWAEPTMMAAE